MQMSAFENDHRQETCPSKTESPHSRKLSARRQSPRLVLHRLSPQDESIWDPARLHHLLTEGNHSGGDEDLLGLRWVGHDLGEDIEDVDRLLLCCADDRS
ncbi:MAG: hypothetical protein ACI9R3_000235 [Verrucomicrobiales bacterium]|jgi:hypothetical protein